MPRLTLLTYATESFANQQRMLTDSARASGFDAVVSLSPDDIRNSDFWAKNRETLILPRGAGYWLWKPYVILQQLQRMDAGEVLIYADAGRDGYYAFSRRPEQIAARALSERDGFVCGVLVPQFGTVSMWTKRDCLILMDGDRADLLKRPTIQATWSAWRNTPQAIDFLHSWLEAASDPRCLTDAASVLGAEHPDFIDHRHDQAICTLLAYQRNAPYLDLSGTGVYRMLSLRPQSRLAQTYLKRPQHSDDLLRGVPALYSLAAGHLRFGRTAMAMGGA